MCQCKNRARIIFPYRDELSKLKNWVWSCGARRYTKSITKKVDDAKWFWSPEMILCVHHIKYVYYHVIQFIVSGVCDLCVCFSRLVLKRSFSLTMKRNDDNDIVVEVAGNSKLVVSYNQSQTLCRKSKKKILHWHIFMWLVTRFCKRHVLHVICVRFFRWLWNIHGDKSCQFFPPIDERWGGESI